MTVSAADREMMRLSNLIEQRLGEVRAVVGQYAQAENAYRKAKAQAWVRAPRETPEGQRMTAAEREAWVDGDTADSRQARDLADGLRQAGFEAVRAARAQLSAWQTAVGLDRAEAEFARTGPR